MARGPDDRGSEIPPERIPITVRLRPRDIKEIIDIPDGSKVQISFLPFGYKQPEAKDMTQEGDEYVYHSEVPPGHFYYSFMIYLPGWIQYYPKSVDLEEDISPGQTGTRVSQGVSFTVEKVAGESDTEPSEDRRGSSAGARVVDVIDRTLDATVGRVIDATAIFARKRREKEQARADREERNHQEDILQNRFPINFRIKPSEWVMFPPDPEVILHIFNAENPTGKKYALRQEGDGFVSDIELPSGPFQYQFEIKSSSSKIIAPIFHPHALKTEEVTEDGSINAKYLGAGITIAQVAPWEPSEKPFAQVGTNEIVDTREQTVASLRKTFSDLFDSVAPSIAQKPGASPNRKALKDFHNGLQHAAERMADITTSRRPDVRALLGRDLLALVQETHNQWIQGRPGLSASVKNQLNTANGRLRFRIMTFNELCNQKKLGLKPKHKIQQAMDESVFLKYARENLGRHWRVFDRICSSYDGGNMHRALQTAVVDTHSEAENMDGFDERGKERNKLLKKVTSRLRKDTKDIYTLDMKRWSKSAKVLEETVDLAAKGSLPVLATMVAFFGLNPWALSVPATLMAVRGISEFLGYDFGSVLWKGGTFPLRLAGGVGRKALNLPPAASALPRASLSLGERFKLLLRGIVPIPTVLTKIPWGGFGEKAEKIVPGSDLDPSETAMQEREHTAGDVEAACKRMLGEGGEHPPAPAPHPPERGPTPPLPEGGEHPPEANP